jgi:GNAT superfamily N-acetyltransferase
LTIFKQANAVSYNFDVYSACSGDEYLGHIEISRSVPMRLERFWMQYPGSSQSSYLTDLIVNKDVRNVGIGSQILRFVENISMESGLQYVRLNSDAKDQTLTSFYTKRGYELLGTHPARQGAFKFLPKTLTQLSIGTGSQREFPVTMRKYHTVENTPKLPELRA